MSSKKTLIIKSIMLLCLTAMFVYVGISLFNYVPNEAYANGECLSPKHNLTLFGCFSSFVIALGCFADSMHSFFMWLDEMVR